VNLRQKKERPAIKQGVSFTAAAELLYSPAAI
jgi:hypothetical protein